METRLNVEPKLKASLRKVDRHFPKSNTHNIVEGLGVMSPVTYDVVDICHCLAEFPIALHFSSSRTCFTSSRMSLLLYTETSLKWDVSDHY